MPHEMPYHALLRQENAALRLMAWGISASCGALTLSVNMDPVVDARNASLLLIFAAESRKVLVRAGAGKSPRELRSRNQCIES
jgi:hypothetical protein